MASVLLKNLPDHTHRLLKARAAGNRRSMSAEAILLIELALDEPAGPPPLRDVDRLRVRGRRQLTQELLDGALAGGRP